jgi:hypothetical protein
MKQIKLELIKVKSHDNNCWNDRADFLAKKGARQGTMVDIIPETNDWLTCNLSWKNYAVETRIRSFIKRIQNTQLGAEWKASGTYKSLEREEDSKELFHWQLFWSHLKELSGVKCNSIARGKRLAFWLKVLCDELPLLQELGRRRPEIYKDISCKLCSDNMPETLEHLAVCKSLRAIWRNIETVASEIAWKELSMDERSLVPLKDFREILFGMKLSDREKVLLRVYLAKGLLPESIFKELETRGIRRRNLKIGIKIFLFSMRNGFHDSIWRERCTKVAEWEKRSGITRSMKRSLPSSKDKKKNAAALVGPKRNTAKEGNTKASRKREVDSLWTKAIEDYIKSGFKPLWFGS